MTHILIVTAQFYKDISDEMTRGAIAELVRAHITYEVVAVPGAFEIPSAIRLAIETGKYQGYIALGCVIRGETTHYDYVCCESARGLNNLALQFKAPIGYGILTVENIEQAWARARINEGNKGRDAADACLALLALKEQWNLT